ncbi:hypothetical protein [Candidatus Uabimicrobium sp. HlEnr_7]|uniref:hypothetical protein n=1 Tax=Candidatus Uabimicrobium helgolandensis TaxID=3095367 RepID=UPI0035587E00
MNRRQQPKYIGDARYFEDVNQGMIMKERIREPLYSKKSFAVDAAQTVNFFRDHTSNSSLYTNLVSNGAMPSNQKFELEGFCFRLKYGMAKTDILKFYNSAVLTFRTHDKTYLKTPMMKIPSGCGLTGLAALDGASSTTEFVELTNGIPSPMVYFPIWRKGENGKPTPILLAPQQTFELEIQTFASAAFSAVFDGTAFLVGQRSRESS